MSRPVIQSVADIVRGRVPDERDLAVGQRAADLAGTAHHERARRHLLPFDKQRVIPTVVDYKRTYVAAGHVSRSEHLAPEGIEQAVVTPDNAFWSAEQGLFILRYDDLRNESEPEENLRRFFDSTYEACASRLDWSPSLAG